MKQSIVLIHGIADTAQCLHKMVVFFRSKGFETFEFEYKPNDGSASLEELAEHLKNFVEEKVGIQGVHKNITLIGFSMGGIIGRYYVQKLGGNSRVQNLITLSSPHFGTIWAYLLGRNGVKQMRIGSKFLKDLNNDVAPFEKGENAPEKAHHSLSVKFVSLYTPLDLIIVPAQSSKVSFAENRLVWVLAHSLMIRSGKVMNIIFQYL